MTVLGYVRAHTPELRVREHECYRALYCGLCKSMGKCTGQCSRMTLSYDFVFLAAVRIALTEEPLTVKRERCIAHWLHPRKVVKSSPALSYCADASALLTYQKLLDDLADEKGGKRLRALLARPFLYGAYRKAKRRHPELDGKIALHLSRLHEYESTPQSFPSADHPASYFGDLMQDVFAEGLSDTDARLAGAVGQAVGRWIYLLDAADDFEEDCKKGRFNPYRAVFGDTLSPEERETIRLSLIAHLGEAEKAFLLIDCDENPDVYEILANVLYLGLPNTAKSILTPKKKKKSKRQATQTENIITEKDS